MARYAARRRVRRQPTASLTARRRTVEPTLPPVPGDDSDVTEFDIELSPEGARDIELGDIMLAEAEASRTAEIKAELETGDWTTDQLQNLQRNTDRIKNRLLGARIENGEEIDESLISDLEATSKAVMAELYERQAREDAEKLEQALENYGPYDRELLDLVSEHANSAELVEEYLGKLKEYLTVVVAVDQLKADIEAADRKISKLLSNDRVPEALELLDEASIDLSQMTQDRLARREELREYEEQIRVAHVNMQVPPSEQAALDAARARSRGLERRNNQADRWAKTSRLGRTGFGRN